MKKFEIIKVSEANVNWEEEDREYMGVIPGYVAGFNYEVVDKNGNVDYMSATYIDDDPSEHVSNWENWTGAGYFETVSWNGFKPTGRVIFRGYAVEHYDFDERDWYVEPAHEEAIASLKNPTEVVETFDSLTPSECVTILTTTGCEILNHEDGEWTLRKEDEDGTYILIVREVEEGAEVTSIKEV